MKVARGNAPSEYPPSDSESRSDALAGVRFFGKLGLVGKLPRSVLGICTARRAPPKAAARVLRKPTASRPSRWIVRKLCEAQERGRISAARAGWMVPDFRWIGRSETQRARPARLNDDTAIVWDESRGTPRGYPPTEGRHRRRSLEWCGGSGGLALGEARGNPVGPPPTAVGEREWTNLARARRARGCFFSLVPSREGKTSAPTVGTRLSPRFPQPQLETQITITKP